MGRGTSGELAGNGVELAHGSEWCFSGGGLDLAEHESGGGEVRWKVVEAEKRKGVPTSGQILNSAASQQSCQSSLPIRFQTIHPFIHYSMNFP